MGRIRTKTRKAKTIVTASTAADSMGPPISSLLEKAQTLIVQCDYDLAGRFVQRILEREPHNAEAREMLGVVQLETGNLDSAKTVGFCKQSTIECRTNRFV